MTSPRARFGGLPHRQAFALAWPMMVANVSVPLVGLVDTAMLGHFSDATHMGAVALGAVVVSAVIWTLSFLRTGTTSLVGRALGGGRDSDAVGHFQRALVLAGILAAVILVVQLVAVPLAMQVLAPEGALRDLATDYTQIRFMSLPAVLLTAVMTGYFIGAQDTRRPLVLAVVVNVVNLGLGVLFVGVLGWQSQGAAASTVIAEWLGLVVAAWLLWRFLPASARDRVRLWRGQGLRRGWGALVRLNSDLFIRTVLLYAALMFLTVAGGRMGATVLAANAILVQLTFLASYGLDGYAHAAEAMSARALGSRRLTEFHRASAAVALPALGIAGAFTAAFLLARDPILGLMTDLPDVTAVAEDYWAWAAWLPLISAAAYALDGIFIGAGQTRAMRNTMLLAVVGVYFPVFFGLSAIAGGASNTALWLAFTLMNVARGVLLGVAYWRLSRGARWLEGAAA